MSVDLLPCPFCKSPMVLTKRNVWEHPWNEDCPAENVRFIAEDEAKIAAWNRRAATSPAGDLVETYRACFAGAAEHGVEITLNAAEAAQVAEILGLRYQSTGVTEAMIRAFWNSPATDAQTDLVNRHWLNGDVNVTTEAEWFGTKQEFEAALTAALTAQERG